MLTLHLDQQQLLRHVKLCIRQKMAKMKLFFMVALFGMTSGGFVADYATVPMYHRWGRQYPHKYPHAQFEAHLDRQWRLYHLATWQDVTIYDRVRSDKTVAITIDDAYLSVFTEARPRPKNRNFPYAVFVVTQPVDRGHRGYMSWDQIRILQDEGVQIGSQTRSHPHMHEISIAEAKNELKISNTRLLQEIGQRPKLSPTLMASTI